MDTFEPMTEPLVKLHEAVNLPMFAAAMKKSKYDYMLLRADN